jgi:hypothetical protein
VLTARANAICQTRLSRAPHDRQRRRAAVTTALP